MINKVVLVGRLTQDVDLRKTPNGASVVQFNLAVNRRKKVQGQADADFINCVAWNQTAELMAQYLHKGSQIGVEGRMQTRSYDNREGQKVYVTEVWVESVSFLEPKRNEAQTQRNEATQYNSYAPMQEEQYDTIDVTSDDLPF